MGLCLVSKRVSETSEGELSSAVCDESNQESIRAVVAVIQLSCIGF